MAIENHASRWPLAWLSALSVLALGLLVAVAMAGLRLSEAARANADLAMRLAQTSSLAAEADARLGALEKAASDAKADRDALREDALKAAAASASAASAAAQKFVPLETAIADAKSVQESLRRNGREATAAADAMKARLDQTNSTLASQGRDVSGLATRIEALKSERDQARRDSQSIATSIAAMKTTLDQTSATLAAAGRDASAQATRLDSLQSQQDLLRQDGQKLAASLDAATAATAALRSSFAWRALSADAKSRLSAALGKAGANGVNLMYMLNDSESHHFAAELGAAFKAAGWQVNYVAASYAGWLLTGLLLNKAGNQATDDVASALKASGLEPLSADLPQPNQSEGGAEEGNPVTLVVGAHALY
jgi:hypothetical protein